MNRELSWLDFNQRVLDQALDDTHPLLERVKSLAIVSSNLDEFFMVRVASLLRKLRAGAVNRTSIDGMTISALLAAIRQRAAGMLKDSTACWNTQLRAGPRRRGCPLSRSVRLHRHDPTVPFAIRSAPTSSSIAPTNGSSRRPRSPRFNAQEFLVQWYANDDGSSRAELPSRRRRTTDLQLMCIRFREVPQRRRQRLTCCTNRSIAACSSAVR